MSEELADEYRLYTKIKKEKKQIILLNQLTYLS